jgi:signal transduction histidine kinase
MFSFKAVDVEQCLDNVIKESALLAARQNLSVSVVKQDALIPLIRGKEQEIGFVLHSLITNALYYGTKGSIVTVTITHESNQVKIAVHNTGQAVPENEKALIFSQFSRSSEAIRLNPDGYGLALYLTHQIIVDHNGTISFASDSKHGTIFTITLPISSHGRLETSINY